MNAGNLPGSVTEGGGGSVLQAMLRDYLTHNKEVLFGEGCSFVKSRLIARLPAPPTIDAVMALACEADIDTCAVRLATMAGVFEKLLPPSAAESKDRDTAYQASLRLLLVLSERYVRSTEAGNQYLARRHEPVWTQDSLLSCVLAAARLVRRLGAQVFEAAAIIDLPELGGSTLLQDAGIPTFCLTAFALDEA